MQEEIYDETDHRNETHHLWSLWSDDYKNWLLVTEEIKNV